jgi:hypothetical protein
MFGNYIKAIGEKYNEHGSANEIEFRLGEMKQHGFESGCPIGKFREISEEYQKGYSIKPEFKYLLNIDSESMRVRLHSTTLSGLTEYINSGVITNSMTYDIIKKHKIETDDSNVDYNFRLNVAHEEKLPNELAQRRDDSYKTFRLVQRWSYSLLPGIVVDMSCIKQCKGRTFKEGMREMSTEKYEVEIDIENPTALYIHSALIDLHLTRLVQILQGNIAIEKQAVLNSVFTEYSRIYDPRLFAQNVPLTNAILKKINKEDLVVVDKADGERYLLYINATGAMYLISGKQMTIWTGITSPHLANSLFDGELMYTKDRTKSEYHIFDILYYVGRDVRELPFYSEDELSIYAEHESIEDKEPDSHKIKLTNTISLKKYVWLSKPAKPAKTTNKISLKTGAVPINEFSGLNKRSIKYNERKEIGIITPTTRYSIIISAISLDIEKTDNFLIRPKYFYPLRMLVFLNKYDIIEINEETQKLTKEAFYELDGLIIQNKNGKYPIQTRPGINPQWNDSYKWKFPNSVTIDFEMIFKNKIAIGDEMTCILRGGASDLQQNFKIITGKIRTIDGAVICNGNIVEFGRDSAGLWIPYRIRDDKTKPNSVHTIMTTLELLDDPVSVVDLI